MKSNYFKLLFFLVCLLSLTKHLGQIPINDQSWQLQFQEDFNSFNSTNWFNQYSWGSTNNGLEYNDPANLNYNNGWLEIKCEKLTTPIPCSACLFSNYYYKSGAIFSKFQYKYGYYEISAKLPVGRGLWPAFWEWNAGSNGIGAPCDFYNEIDVVENGGGQSISGQEMGFNIHHLDIPTCNFWHLSGGTIPPGVIVGDITQEHRYAVLWEPNKITYFFDDSPVKVVEDNVHTITHPLSTIINLAIDQWTTPDNTTIFPAYFKINYLKISQLNTNCSTVENICIFNKTTYNYSVKKSINISGCNNTIYTSDNVNFWATDFITLDVGTEIISDGFGTFCAYTTNCPN